MDLHALVTVVREKSISKASQVLHLSQPALTIRIKKLEQELGFVLLERTRSGVKLTKQGASIIHNAAKAIQQMNAMSKFEDNSSLINQIKLLHPELDDIGETFADNGNNLKVGIAVPLGWTLFKPITNRLRSLDPNLKYHMLSDSNEVILQLLQLGDIDLGIVPYFEPKQGLESIPIMRDEMLLLGPKNEDRLDIDNSEGMAALLDKTFFVFYSNQPLRLMINEVMLKLMGNVPKDIRNINDTGIILKMVSDGLGYTICPSSFMYDTMEFFHSLYGPDDLPSLLQHETVPFQIYRLGKDYPSRTIQMIYPASFPYRHLLQVSSDTSQIYGRRD
nr:LysR family transcriptional regulator [Paenibacillus beijingensis]